MKRILLIGQEPILSPQTTQMGFAQLRMWSMEKLLRTQNYDVQVLRVPKTISFEKISLSQNDYDAIVTAGPFASAYATLSLPSKIPLWLDWPSDPRADLHARLHANQDPPSKEDEAFVAMLHRLALTRADAIGVISQRQYWATLSTLMENSLHDADLANRIHITPISFDFPFTPAIKSTTKKYNIALCGSINSWFDSQRAKEYLAHALQHSQNIHVHVFGGAVSHQSNHHILSSWKHPQVHIHGWLSQQEFHTKLSSQHIGFWLNRNGIEPLLGSRTRALLFAWMKQDIVASCDTELMQELHRENLVWNVRNREDLWNGLTSPKHHGEKLFAYCQTHFSPQKVFTPLLQWLKEPQKRPSPQKEAHAEELHKLREELNKIHQSPTWKWGSRLHRILRKLRSILPV